MRPYHLARLAAAERACGDLFSRVQGIAVYDHTGAMPPPDSCALPVHKPEVLLPGDHGGQPRRAIREALDRLRPAAIAICGYASPDARECLRWARRNGTRAILMTETRESDAPRHWWKEQIKGLLVRRFHGALCGGREASDYLVKLGMDSRTIEPGYDVVDNGYFARETEDFKTQDTRGELSVIGYQLSGGLDGEARNSESSGRRLGAPDEPGTTLRSTHNQEPLTNNQNPYFLASNRFIERKNVGGLIEAYAEYVKSFQCSVCSFQEEEAHEQTPESSGQPLSIAPSPDLPISPSPVPAPWHLCLLGDGELKGELLAKCAALGLQVIEAAPWEHLPTKDQGPRTKDATKSPPSSLPPDSCPLTPGLVFFPGWRCHTELPRFYALAGAFVHPALNEPWGLVVNEAMASALPILAGRGTSAAIEMLDDGINGWIVDVRDKDAFASALARIATLPPDPLAAFGAASRRILEERCPTRAFGEGLAKLLAASPRPWPLRGRP